MDERTIQLPYLETFSKAAELSSFTRAAKSLHLTQAAVSQRIQAVEKSLNKSLFKRHGGRVMLTDAGRKLYDIAQRIFDLHCRARLEIAGHESPLAGELPLAASSIPGEHFLPAILSEFSQKYPHIRTRATITDSAAVIADVERGDAVLGFVGRKANNPNLEFWHLASDRMILVVPPGHALSKRKKMPVKVLTQYPLVMREAGSGLRHCFEKSLEEKRRSLSDFQVVLELGSNEAIKEAVLRGVGVAVLSEHAVRKEIAAKQLHGIEIADLHCDRHMYIVKDKRRVMPLPARTLLAFIESHTINGSAT